jgi:hypothetical protein
MDSGRSIDLALVWRKAPIGVTVYEPVLSEDGVLLSMRLVYVNEAVSSRAGLRPDEMRDWPVEKVIGDSNWTSIRGRYQQMLADGQPITYARTYDNPALGGRFSYVASAWYAAPWVGVQVKEASNDELNYLDDQDIRAALDVVDARSKRTLELAELLSGQHKPFHG